MTVLRELIASFFVGADTKQLDKADEKLDKAKAKSGVLGTAFARMRAGIQAWNQRASDQMEALQKKAGAVGEVIKRVGGAMGALALVASARSFVSEFVAEARELETVSRRLRTTTQEMQILRAVGASAGLDLNGMVGVLSTLRTRLDNAVRTGEGAYSFRRLGVQFRNADRTARPLFQVFGDVAMGLSRVTKESRRLMLTEQMLGPEGYRFRDMFGDNADAIRDFSEALAASGGGLSDNSIRSARELSQAWNLAGLSIDTLRSRLAVQFLPKLTEFIRVANRAVIALNRTTVVTNTIRLAFAALTAYVVRGAYRMAAANLALTAQWLVIAAGIAIVILAVDDLITLFKGGKSVIGGFIDEIFGVGTAQQMVDDLKESFHNLEEFVTTAKNAVVQFWDSLHLGGDSAADAVNRIPSNAPARLAANDPRNDTELARRIRANMNRRRMESGGILPAPVQVPLPGSASGASGRLAGAFGTLPATRGGNTRVEVGATSVSVEVHNPPNTSAIRRTVTDAVAEANRQREAATLRQLQDSGLIQVLPDGG